MSQKKIFSRRKALKSLGIAGAGTIAGCMGFGGGGGGNGGDQFRVGMVFTTAGLGDEGFNDAAMDGLQRAKKELGISFNYAEPESSDQYSTFLRQYAKGDYDLVCGLSFEMATAMNQVAKDFPNQPFTIVDVAVKGDNIASYLFKEHEGCYLVGIMNGMLTQRQLSAHGGSTNEEKIVGFVGGKKNPVIEKFHAGYKAGIKSFEEDIEFLSAYAGTWTRPSKGRSIAESMYNEGADIVFPAAGGTGLGVFQAAQAKNRYAVGVDKPQSKATPKYADVILGSMVKHVGEAFYRSIQNTMNNNHRGGDQVVLGLEREGVALVYGTKLGDNIPQEVKSQVSSVRKKIINGKIDVPSTIQQY
ncbi:MAG: BMP family protein [Halobacteriaceae archaeon]